MESVCISIAYIVRLIDLFHIENPKITLTKYDIIHIQVLNHVQSS